MKLEKIKDDVIIVEAVERLKKKIENRQVSTWILVS